MLRRRAQITNKCMEYYLQTGDLQLISGSVIWQQVLTLKVLVATIDAQWEGMGDVGSARYEPALLPP